MEKQDRRKKTKLTGFRGLLSLITVLWEGDWSQEVKSLRQVFTNFMSPYLPFFFLDQLITVAWISSTSYWHQRHVCVKGKFWLCCIFRVLLFEKKYWNDNVIMNFFSSLFAEQLLHDSMGTINFTWYNLWSRRQYLCYWRNRTQIGEFLIFVAVTKVQILFVSVLLPELC